MRKLEISECRSVFNHLEEENSLHSLPTRGMLQNTLNGSFRLFSVFVDRWPNFSEICVIQDMKEISPVYDWDFATIWASNVSNFIPFLCEIAKKQNWFHRNVILAGLELKFKIPAMNALRNLGSQAILSISGPFQMSVAKSDQPLVPDMAKLRSKLPKGFEFSSLMAEDVKTVANFWDYDYFPDKLAYLQWLIEHLPSSCIRDSIGKPVSWNLEYQFGAGAAWFTLPEYRRTGLTQLLIPYAHVIHHQRSSVPRFGGTELENARSKKAAAKFFDLIDDIQYVWIIRRPVSSKL